jgi:ligand-binding SRPBCC domain-containing protein
MSTFRFRVRQQVNASVEDAWDFISSPANLKHITPRHMGFDILTPDLPQKMYEGMMIEYKVRPLPFFPTRWLTEITHIREGEFFVDEQRAGPYKLWHHEHHIQPAGEGVLMTDIIHYIPPMGLLGTLANYLFIRKQVQQIFKYREAALEERFPGGGLVT